MQGALPRVEVSQNLAAAPCRRSQPKRNGTRARLLTNRIQLDTLAMSTLIRSSVFSDWLNRLKDQKARAAETAPAVASLPGHGEGIEGERAMKKAKAKGNAKANAKAK